MHNFNRNRFIDRLIMNALCLGWIVGLLATPAAVAAEAAVEPDQIAAAAALRARAAAPAQVSVAARARAARLLRRIGALGAQTPLTRIRIGDGPRDRSFLQSRTASRSATRATGPLTFKLSGFSAAETTEFQGFIARVYPLMVQVYGEPAPIQRGRGVSINFNAAAGDGLYQPPANPQTDPTNGGTILYAPVQPGGGVSAERARAVNHYNLTRQMLIAFHGPLIFAFDAWELGFSDAAALVVNFLEQGSPGSFDPSQLGVYLLPVYDLFNRPELGNPFFFSADSSAGDTSVNLGFYRGGMAQAAWLKVYVENPDFFRQFNAIYYARASTPAGPALAHLDQNTIYLKQIAAGIVPTVEGLRFEDWFRRQHVLDTGVTTGDKLWFVARALTNLTTGDTRSVFQGIAQRYRTLANGDEQPLSGRGRLVAFDENGGDITSRSAELSSDNEVIFNLAGEAEVNLQGSGVAGFRGTGTPDQGRISLVLRVGASEAVAFFPYNVAGTTAAPTGFYGATLGTNRGAITVRVVGGAAASPSIARGAFSAAFPYPSGPRVRTDFILNPGDGAASRTLRRNSAWAIAGGVPQSLAVLLETAPGANPFTVNVPNGANNNLRMLSLPFFPRDSDEATVLNVDPRTLLLARYRTNLSPAGFMFNGIRYGLTADKYELYPNISEPFAPGRGYWIKVPVGLSRVVTGGEPSRATPYEVPLLGGWNQVGVPYNQIFQLQAVRVRQVQGNTVSEAVPFATAVANGWINPGVWRWKPEGGYARVDTGLAIDERLQPYEGYYIFTSQPRGVKLVFDSARTTAPLTAAPALSAASWRLPLTATMAGAADVHNALGVTAVGAGLERMPAAKPPAATRALTLSFLSGGTDYADTTRAGAESGWAESFVEPFAHAATWRFIVDGATPGQTVRLAWGTLPAAMNLTLVDETAGRATPMTGGSYTFGARESARRFRIEAVMRPALGTVSVQELRGSRRVNVKAEVLEPGTVTVAIKTVHGQLVRTLVSNQPVQSGARSWLWDGMASRFPMPIGYYVAHVTLVDGSGVTHRKTARFFLF